MNEPVRLSLVFPRSGQQLYVHLPRQQATLVETGGQSELPRSDVREASFTAEHPRMNGHASAN